ncbi:hypothetical protein Pelo_6944 [Pelomyxa schiedti]|nr:hypothetical protein Pelo_6944 [Pelomyxa schiedti]
MTTTTTTTTVSNDTVVLNSMNPFDEADITGRAKFCRVFSGLGLNVPTDVFEAVVTSTFVASVVGVSLYTPVAAGTGLSGFILELMDEPPGSLAITINGKTYVGSKLSMEWLQNNRKWFFVPQSPPHNGTEPDGCGSILSEAPSEPPMPRPRKPINLLPVSDSVLPNNDDDCTSVSRPRGSSVQNLLQQLHNALLMEARCNASAFQEPTSETTQGGPEAPPPSSREAELNAAMSTSSSTAFKAMDILAKAVAEGTEAAQVMMSTWERQQRRGEKDVSGDFNRARKAWAAALAAFHSACPLMNAVMRRFLLADNEPKYPDKDHKATDGDGGE